MSPEMFFPELLKTIEISSPGVDIHHAWNQLVVGPLLGAEKIFDLFSQHAPICALSNTNITHYEYFMQTFPIAQRFYRLLTSFELNLRKPNPEIYLRACEVMNVAPEDCVFFDDLLVNVEAAKAAGMRAFHSVNSTQTTLDHLHRLFSAESYHEKPR
jgi:putative hydrolase of the HAD superfamily